MGFIAEFIYRTKLPHHLLNVFSFRTSYMLQIAILSRIL